MIEQKNRYLFGLLTIILLAIPSGNFAGENESASNEPSWWTKGEGYLGNVAKYSWDKASDAAKSSWENVKSYAPYAPAAALTGLGMLALRNDDNVRAFLATTAAAGTAAALANQNAKASQFQEQKKERSWIKNLAPYLVPATAMAGGSIVSGRRVFSPDTLGLAAALTVPALAATTYRSYSHMNSFKQIRDNLQEKVNAVLYDKNPNANAIFLDKSILPLITQYDEYYKYVQDDLPEAERIPNSYDFISQVTLTAALDQGLIGIDREKDYTIPNITHTLAENEHLINILITKVYPINPFEEENLNLFVNRLQALEVD